MCGKDTVLYTLLDSAKLRFPMDVPASVRRQRVDEVMDIFGLKPVQNNLVEKLSGGQKKRLSISIEFLSNPSLFILDEPEYSVVSSFLLSSFCNLSTVVCGNIISQYTVTTTRYK